MGLGPYDKVSLFANEGLLEEVVQNLRQLNEFTEKIFRFHHEYHNFDKNPIVPHEIGPIPRWAPKLHERTVSMKAFDAWEVVLTATAKHGQDVLV